MLEMIFDIYLIQMNMLVDLRTQILVVDKKRQFLLPQKDKVSNEWPDVVTLWKATHMKPNGTWSVSNGEEIMNKLREEGEKNQEKISSAPIPLVEHFSLVLGITSNYSRGIGVGGITSTSQVKSRILAETIVAKKRAESKVARLTEITEKQDETNIQLQNDIEAQREELIAQGKAIEKQTMELQQVRELFARFASEQSVSNLFSNASQSNSATSSARKCSKMKFSVVDMT
ncbi:hypothetical protein V6N11_010039 [Hibiscus sabdariffa]|uniref:Uncharacterized protein n=1 Tax=Hibiscus sabdariffa TaxID=183260 RepID=A0ABR2PDF5_9ROSI